MKLNGERCYFPDNIASVYKKLTKAPFAKRYTVGVDHECALGKTFGIKEQLRQSDGRIDVVDFWLIMDIPTKELADSLCDFINSQWCHAFVGGAGKGAEANNVIFADVECERVWMQKAGT